jgi:hypothetical protein
MKDIRVPAIENGKVRMRTRASYRDDWKIQSGRLRLAGYGTPGSGLDMAEPTTTATKIRAVKAAARLAELGHLSLESVAGLSALLLNTPPDAPLYRYPGGTTVLDLGEPIGAIVAHKT